nr:GTPase [Clostridium sp. ZBS18]
MEGIDSHRPPRIFLIGRTGVGKSSLINALCGAYVAGVSDTKSCTRNANISQYKENDRVLMEILDTRGIAESESLYETISAEEMLINEINEFSPDVAILMLNCTHRDDVNSDVEFLKKITKAYEEINKLRLPIVVVVNKCDEMAPTRFKTPSEYPANKISKINEVVQYYKGIIIKNGLKIENIIGVSSLIDWQTPDGMEVDVEDIENLPKYHVDNMQIAFDGRYRIEELLDILEEAIQDFEPQMGLRMASRLKEVVDRIARHLNKIFSGISATVALTPIPVSDIYVLLILQSVLVSLIASLSGRDISLDTAKEFIFSMGGIAGSGYAFRLLAQQASKLLNAV